MLVGVKADVCLSVLRICICICIRIYICICFCILIFICIYICMICDGRCEINVGRSKGGCLSECAEKKETPRLTLFGR